MKPLTFALLWWLPVEFDGKFWALDDKPGQFGDQIDQANQAQPLRFRLVDVTRLDRILKRRQGACP